MTRSYDNIQVSVSQRRILFLGDAICPFELSVKMVILPLWSSNVPGSYGSGWGDGPRLPMRNRTAASQRSQRKAYLGVQMIPLGGSYYCLISRLRKVENYAIQKGLFRKDYSERVDQTLYKWRSKLSSGWRTSQMCTELQKNSRKRQLLKLAANL